MNIKCAISSTLLILSVAACSGRAKETPTYRYRLTVEVETPHGLRLGSSVIEVRQRLVRPGSSPVHQAIERRARGEAVTVDLPGGRKLFALLRSEDDVDWAETVMQTAAPRVAGESYEEQFDNVCLIKSPVVLPPRWPPVAGGLQMAGYPILVTFADLRHPSSIKRVEPSDLPAIFGAGFHLKRITVQITDDKITTGIKEQLTWFRDLARTGGSMVPVVKDERGRHEVVQGFDESLADLGLSHFSTEAYN